MEKQGQLNLGEENAGGAGENQEKPNAETAAATTVNAPAKTIEEAALTVAQRQAKALAASDLLPQQYRGNIANCMIAIEMAGRTNMPPIMVMQNLDIIHGRPSWRSTFAIAVVNASKRFSSPLNYRMTNVGDHDKMTCVAFATGLDGLVYESPTITMEMAKAEGWYSKSGSKWKTMPELMIRYRAAAFFSRLYCPELLLGMPMDDEVFDIMPAPAESDFDELNRLFTEKINLVDAATADYIRRILDNKEELSYKKAITTLKAL